MRRTINDDNLAGLDSITVPGGTYLLEIKAGEPFTISSPAFIKTIFPAGYYYYSGSAQKSLKKRLERHLRKDKIIHWHIDHISSSDKCVITGIFISEGASRDNECRMNAELISEYGMTISAKGFGNSDCDKCISHLLFSKEPVKEIKGMRRIRVFEFWRFY